MFLHNFLSFFTARSAREKLFHDESEEDEDVKKTPKAEKQQGTIKKRRVQKSPEDTTDSKLLDFTRKLHVLSDKIMQKTFQRIVNTANKEDQYITALKAVPTMSAKIAAEMNLIAAGVLKSLQERKKRKRSESALFNETPKSSRRKLNFEKHETSDSDFSDEETQASLMKTQLVEDDLSS